MYTSLQFALDGEHITDYKCNTIDQTWSLINDQGSRWIFYPLAFVVKTDTVTPLEKRRVHAPDLPLLRDLDGASVATVEKFIRDNSEILSDILYA